MQYGGCHPVDGCQFDTRFGGARFPILGANVTFAKNNLPALPPFTVDPFRRGEHRRDRRDPEGSARRGGAHRGQGPAVRRRGQGDRPGLAAAPGARRQEPDRGDAPGRRDRERRPERLQRRRRAGQAIAKAASPNVDAFFLGHTHQQYNCTVTDPAGNPRPVIQGLSFGRLLSVVDLKIDPRTRDVIRSATSTANNPVARNVIVTRTVPPDPAVEAIVDKAVTKSAPMANRQVGTITADITRSAPASGEATAGDVHRRRPAGRHQGRRRPDRHHEPGRDPGGSHLRQLAGRRGQRGGHLRRGVRGPAVRQHHADDHLDRCAAATRCWSSSGSRSRAARRPYASCRSPPASLQLEPGRADRIRGLRHHGERGSGRPGRDVPGGGEQLPGRAAATDSPCSPRAPT